LTGVLASAALIVGLLGCATSAGSRRTGTPPALASEHTAGQSDQFAPVAAPPPPGPISQVDDLSSLGGSSRRYTLGPGDVITVTVWAHPELSGKHVIGPDGDIQLPFVGSIRLSNLSADDASAKLTQVLREMYVLSVATVTIDSYSGNQVLVLGHVLHPGVHHFSDQPTLLEALAKAGAGVDGGKDSLDGMATRCAIVRGSNRLIWVDLRPLMRGQDAAFNLTLQRNDVVYVPDPDSELVYVMGEVKSPGAYTLTANMSFLEALTRAGGTTDAAQTGKVVRERPGQHLQEVIDLQHMVNNGQTNYQLEAGDIVYVPKSGIAKFGYVLQQINPITTLTVLGAAL
jgi:polysaccharide biosynthesis/export protein